MLAFLLVLMFGQCEECPPGPWKVAVFELSGVGVEKELATTISDLLRVELDDCEKYRVIDKGTMIDTLGENLVVTSMEKAIEHSESLGVSLAVIGHMSKLGEKIIISVSLINRWSKERVFSDKLIATSVEDLDVVIKRLASGLCEMKKAERRVTVETITEEEAKPRRRRESYHTTGLMLGYLFPLGGSYGKKVEGDIWSRDVQLVGDVRNMPGGSGLYFYETPYYMGEVAYRFHTRSLAHYMGIEFSGYRFLSLEDISPYIGGGIGMGRGTRAVGVDTTGYPPYVETEGFDGLTVNVGGGIMFPRTYDFRFLLNLKYHVVFGEGTPSGLILSFGVIYKKTGAGCGCGF